MALPVSGQLVDTLKGSILTLALFLAYITFPLVGMLPGLIVPLPGIYFSFKRGATTGLLIVTISALVLASLGERSVPVLYLLQCGVISLLLPIFYRQGKGGARAIVAATGVNFLLIVGLAVGYGALKGIDLQALLVKGIETSIGQTSAFYEKQGLKGEELQILKQGLEQGARLIEQLFPALLLVSLGCVAALNLAVVLRMAARLPGLPAAESFTRFRNPEMLVWVVIAAGFAMLVPEALVNKVALNILVVTGVLYLLQGLAIVQHFLERFATPRFLRVILYLLLTLQPYLLLLLAVIGIFDIWGDFRTPRTKNL